MQNSTRSIRVKATFVMNALAASVLLAQHAHAVTPAAPTAGNFINNTAIASYVDNDGLGKSLSSNTVAVQVAALYAIDLSQAATQQVESGASVTWLNTLSNLSNATATVDVSSIAPSTLSNVQFYLDLNGNGQIDANETPITGSITLDREQTVQLIVRADTSTSLNAGQQVDLPLTATVSEDSTVTKTATDSLIAIIPELIAIKTVDKADIDPSNVTGVVELTYQLSVENRSSIAVRPIDVSIDGVNQQVVLIKDALPPNTTYVDATANNPDALVVYKTGVDSYTIQQPANKTSINELYVAYQNGIAANKIETVNLKLSMNAGVTATTLSNIFNVEYSNATGTKQTRVSNAAETNVTGGAGIQTTNSGFNTPVSTGSVNKPLYIAVDSAACNIDREVRDQILIEVISPETGDIVTVVALETSANSGRYQVELPTQNSATKIADEILQTLRGDQVSVTLTSCADSAGQPTTPQSNINTTVYIDPYGTVFDSQTNQPIVGARVVLLDSAGQPLTGLIGDDGNPVSSTQVSAADGTFSYPLLNPGSYKLTIESSSIDGFVFPSSKSSFDPALWNINTTGSFGQTFVLSGTAQPVSFDLPVDPVAKSSALSVTKVASVSSAEIGDFVDYTVTVTHSGNGTSPDVNMQDTLPRGFVYVSGSMRVDGKKVADPDGGKGPYLKLGLGNMSTTNAHKVQYRVYIGPNSLNGTGINRVTAKDSNNISSLEASAKVTVSPGVLMSDAFIIGKVYTDCNRNGMQDAGEHGVPGVRLYLEDGSFVVTDSEGKYDFYGVSAKTHVLKLDRTTLPSGVELVEQGNRNAGDPGSRFVDLKYGELHRADFAMTDGSSTCSDGLAKQITERQKLVGDQNTDIERVLRADLTLDPNYSLGDVRSMPSSGCISANGINSNCNVAMPASDERIAAVTQPTVERIKAPETIDLESALKTATNNKLEVLNLKDQQVLPYPQANVQIKAVAGTSIELRVNDKLVSDSRIGKKAILADRQVAGFDYIGVNLNEGKNLVEVRQIDSMGIERGRQTLSIIAPGKMNNVVLRTDQNVLEANGRNVMNVIVSIVDKAGVPVASRTPITLDSNIGRIQLEDLDPTKPGVQQFIEGGQLLVPVLSSKEAGEGQLMVSSGTFRAAQPIRFVPELRPMIASGIVEGGISLRSFDPGALSKVSRDDGFEQELNELSDGGDGKLGTNGRAAFFLKGKVKGEYLLTMAYDSDKDKDQRLFRDIRPDEYYPVYGDSAAKGFDAQSTSKLYVRVDKGRSYAMYGDFVTRVESDEGLSLGQYSRSLTGARVHHENNHLNVTGFASRTNSRQIVTETRGKGISGPYSLGNVSVDDLVTNSEKVEVLVRDRDNPGLIISRQTLARFSDYEIDSLTNTLYLKDPISSIDGDFNPKSLRITIEADEGGENYNVGGVAGRVRVTDQVNIGGSYTKSDDPADQQEIASVNVVAKLSDRVKLITEVARSDSSASASNSLFTPNVAADPTGTLSGNAARVELSYATDAVEARVYHNQADTEFYNPASPISSGRKESGIRVQARIPQVGLAKVEAIRTEDIANNGVRDGLSASVERAINQYLALEVGARFYEETTAAASDSSVAANTPYKGTTVRAKLNAILPWVQGASTFIEYEQDVSDADRKVLALGGSYQLGNNGRVYARHELVSSISGLYGLNDTTERNSTIVGVDSNYMKDGTVFSEYRLRDGISAREAEAALGLRNRWSLGKGIRLNTSFERIESLEGTDTSSDATAVSLGLEYLTNPLWKGVAKLEMRWADQSDTLINTLGAAYKATDDMTLLAKNVYNKVDNKNSGDRLIDRFQIGTAYRPQDNNRFDALAKLEYRYDDNQTSLTGTTREALIASVHTNYHPARRLTLSSQYAAKYVQQDMEGLSTDGITQLLSGRVIYDINERWDASLNGGAMWSNVSAGTRYLVGAEVGYLLTANLWLSGGYNFVTYQDEDLVDSDTTVKGAYMRLRFKFDEDLFNVGSAAINKSVEPNQ